MPDTDRGAQTNKALITSTRAAVILAGQLLSYCQRFVGIPAEETSKAEWEGGDSSEIFTGVMGGGGSTRDVTGWAYEEVVACLSPKPNVLAVHILYCPFFFPCTDFLKMELPCWEAKITGHYLKHLLQRAGLVHVDGK